MRMLWLTLIVLVLVASAQSSAAAQQVYFGRDASKADLTNANVARSDFLSHLASFGVEDLETKAGVADPMLAFGATGITATTDFDTAFSFASTAVSGTVALLDKGPAAADGPAFDDFMVLSQPVTAFGSYFTQGGDGNANTLTLRLENTMLGMSKDVMLTLGPGWEFFNVFFLGVTDADPFNRVTMIESLDFDGILLDDITVGTLVPEPGAFGLWAAGALAAGLAGRYSGPLRPAWRKRCATRLRVRRI
jgi:hypothetical protein